MHISMPQKHMCVLMQMLHAAIATTTTINGQHYQHTFLTLSCYFAFIFILFKLFYNKIIHTRVFFYIEAVGSIPNMWHGSKNNFILLGDR